eukprot:s628_g12.t1
MVEEIHGDREASSFAVSDATDCDMDCLKAYTDSEVQTTAGEVLKLHRKLGRPSRQAFLKMLRDRGAGKLIRTLASIVHCPDCQEAAVPPSRRAVTIEQATELWEVIQIDNMEITVGDLTYHFQIVIDEASGYGAANFLFKHNAAASRNPTTLECVEALYKGWIQYFGYPKMIKLDKEGAHRGRTLEEWGEGHGVEVQADDDMPEETEVDPRHQVQPGLEGDRLLGDPEHFPLQPPDPAPLYRHPLFLQARQRHERLERPHHVQRQEFLQRGTLETADENMFVDEEETLNEVFLAQVEHYAYAVTLPTPETEAEWRAIVKDPSRFVAKKLAKGVEVSWQRLSAEQRAAMKEAKGIEIKEWIAAKVCKVAVGDVPPERMMRMRWVLVLTGTDDPKVVKAKARLVVVGFTDPDLGMEDVRSPTLSRRGRQCLLHLEITKDGQL